MEQSRKAQSQPHANSEMASLRRRIILFPFLAQGHIIPFLELASFIARRHSSLFSVTLVSTPLNIRNLRQSLPPDSSVHLREIPFCSTDHGLPPNSENSDSVSLQDLIRLFQASTSLQAPFERLIEEEIAGEDGVPPLCIIADVFFSWSVHVAQKLGVFHATFTTCGGLGTAAYFSLWIHLPHLQITSEEDEFSVPGFPESFRLRRSQLSWTLRAADGTDPWSLAIGGQVSLCSSSAAMLCNTVEELEPEGVALLRKITGLRVWSVWRDSAGKRVTGKTPGVLPEACVEWLDAHPPSSVLYVSFGSQNSVSAPQMTALAAGLEAARRPFIWVLRPPVGFDVNGEFRAEWLPEGFEERMGGSGLGLLVRNWAPQLDILSHESVGAFVTHCGWNSVTESLRRGVPLISWPMAADQFYNSKMLEEMGLCVELARGTEQRVSAEEVESVVSLVMGGEKGEEMRRNAGFAGQKIRAASREDGDAPGSSVAALDDFLATVLKSATPENNH